MKKYRFDDHILYHGDVLEVLGQMKPQSCDLVIGSPPYEKARSYGIDFKLEGQEFVDWMVKVFKASLRVCRGLVAFVVGHGSHGARNWSGVPALLAADLIRDGIVLRNPPIIYYRIGIPGSGHSDWARADYEWVICATNKAERLSWSDNTAMTRANMFPPGGNVSHRERNGQRENARRPGRKVIVKKPNPGNVIFCTVGGKMMGSLLAHSTEAPFPEKIPKFFIKSLCRPGGTVLDPFLGSGTSLAVALQLGRKGIGIDIRKSQIKLSLRRLREAKAKYESSFGL